MFKMYLLTSYNKFYKYLVFLLSLNIKKAILNENVPKKYNSSLNYNS